MEDTKEKEISDLLGRIKTASLSEQEARDIVQGLQVAIEKRDRNYISSVCNKLSHYGESCDKLFECGTISCKYGNPIEIIDGKLGSCNHAYVYVESDFTSFNDSDKKFFFDNGINEIDIIGLGNDRREYVNLEEEKINKSKRDGWIIFVGVVLIIGIIFFFLRKGY